MVPPCINLYVLYINSAPRSRRFLHQKTLKNFSAESYRHCSRIRYLAVGRDKEKRAGKSAYKEVYCRCGHNRSHNPCHDLYHNRDLCHDLCRNRHCCSRFRKYRTHYSCCRSNTTKVKSISNCSFL